MSIKSVKVSEKTLSNYIISLKKPSALEKIIEKVPKPQGAVPNFGLPKWKILPLEAKIPMIPGPDNAYNFARRKLGKKLWVQPKNAPFNLSDPCNYEMVFAYDSMHDEHLTRYFSRETNIRRMLQLGFITNDLDAKCSLKDYNMYRKFLRKLHSDRINWELKRLASLADEKRVIELADNAAQKEIERLKVEERKKLAKEKLVQQEEKKFQEKLRQREERTAKLKKNLESLELAKQEEYQKRIGKAKAQSDSIKRKRAAAIESTRHKVIETLIAWTKKEAKRRKTRKLRLAREAEAKHMAIEKKWEIRKQEEKAEIRRTETALDYAEKQRETFIKNYTKKIERERACMQKQFKKIRRFVTCQIARRMSGSKERSCCRKFRGKRKVQEKYNAETVNLKKPNINLMNKKKGMKTRGDYKNWQYLH